HCCFPVWDSVPHLSPLLFRSFQAQGKLIQCSLLQKLWEELERWSQSARSCIGWGKKERDRPALDLSIPQPTRPADSRCRAAALTPICSSEFFSPRKCKNILQIRNNCQ